MSDGNTQYVALTVVLLPWPLLDTAVDLIARLAEPGFFSSDPTNAAGRPNAQRSRRPIPGNTLGHRPSALAHTVIGCPRVFQARVHVAPRMLRENTALTGKAPVRETVARGRAAGTRHL